MPSTRLPPPPSPRPEPCGAELSPEKTIVFVDPSRLERLASRREIRVGLDPEFLAARAVALVAFEGVSER